jgi:predicted nucleotidyltransferase
MYYKNGLYSYDKNRDNGNVFSVNTYGRNQQQQSAGFKYQPHAKLDRNEIVVQFAKMDVF